jgi:hypothetical protein
MKLWRVLWWMIEPSFCEQTGISIPECCCRDCCLRLLWHFAPALLDVGSLDMPCPVVGPAVRTIDSYTNVRGISEGEIQLGGTPTGVGV